MWMAHFFYWGCNQYITQRALAAKSIKEAQRGLLLGGYLKLLTPLIVVIPGIVAFALKADIAKSDEAYPWLLSQFVPVGFKGLAFAALIAAIVSSLSSMVNSTATIFSMDIYKQIIKKDASETQLVLTGRVASAVALIIAVLIAPTLSSLEQAFQFIQEFTGFISPGIFAIFIFGLFWKKATANSAIWAAVLTIPLSLGIKALVPALPFLNRMGVVFLLLSLTVVIITLIESRGDAAKAIKIEKGLFHTDTLFNVGSIGIFAILAVLYIMFW
ncbi:MAG: sodium/glucose cotransporter, partial [Candidatus Marinimicrobia bacterium]|nr:sodium/glucose cotransporter [Candidatus Neomarinimicrobiota bacterium]